MAEPRGDSGVDGGGCCSIGFCPKLCLDVALEAPDDCDGGMDRGETETCECSALAVWERGEDAWEPWKDGWRGRTGVGALGTKGVEAWENGEGPRG